MNLLVRLHLKGCIYFVFGAHGPKMGTISQNLAKLGIYILAFYRKIYPLKWTKGAEGRHNGPLKISYESGFGPSPKKFQGGHIEILGPSEYPIG